MGADAKVEQPGRVRRAAWTWSAGIVYTVSTMLIGFVATPILLRLLGGERLGAFRAMGEWVGYLTAVDLGLAPALGVFLLRSYTGQEPESLRPLLRFGLGWMSLVAATIMLPLGLALVWYVPQLIHVRPSMTTELRMATLITIVTVLFYPLGIFRSALDVTQRGYLVVLSSTAQSLVTTAIGIGLAYAGRGLTGQAIAGVAGIGIASILYAWSATRGLPDATADSNLPTRSALWRTSWPLALAGMGNRLNLMTDSIVVGSMLGPLAVTTLFLTQRLITLAGAQVNGLAGVSWAALAELHAKGERLAFERRLAELTTLVVTLGIILTGTVAAYNKHFMRLWVGKTYDGGALLSIFTAAGSVTFGFVCLFAWIIDMQGDTRLRLRVSLVGSVLNLTFSVLAVRAIGVPGVALGTLAAYLLTDAWYCPTLVCKRYGVRPRAIIGALRRALVLGVPWTIAVWLVASLHVPRLGWIGLIGEECALAAAGLTYCWFVILPTEDRTLWRARLALLKRR